MFLQLDPTMQKIPNMSDEGGTGCLLLNQLRCFDDTCEVVLDFTTIVTSDANTVGSDDEETHGRHQQKIVDVRPLAGVCIWVFL